MSGFESRTVLALPSSTFGCASGSDPEGDGSNPSEATFDALFQRTGSPPLTPVTRVRFPRASLAGMEQKRLARLITSNSAGAIPAPATNLTQRSSAAEHSPHKGKDMGSNPIAATSRRVRLVAKIADFQSAEMGSEPIRAITESIAGWLASGPENRDDDRKVGRSTRLLSSAQRGYIEPL